MPRVSAARASQLSPWVTVVAKDAELVDGSPIETYHVVRQRDYVGVLARTPSGRIAIVRQFRPAVEVTTSELVGGLVEPGEDPADAARRELLEETGLRVRRMVSLGTHWADVGRLENRQHAFYAETDEPEVQFVPEPGLAVTYVPLEELERMAITGEFAHSGHLAILLLFNLKVARTTP